MHRISPSKIKLWDAFSVGWSTEDQLIEQLTQPVASNVYMDNGNALEQWICSGEQSNIEPIGRSKSKIEQKHIDAVLSHFKNGIAQTQLHVQKDYEDVLFHGFVDVVDGAGRAYDIKYSKKFALDKFKSNPQHNIYMYCMGLEQFKYVCVSHDGVVWDEEYLYGFDAVRDEYHRAKQLLDFMKCHKLYTQLNDMEVEDGFYC